MIVGQNTTGWQIPEPRVLIFLILPHLLVSTIWLHNLDFTTSASFPYKASKAASVRLPAVVF